MSTTYYDRIELANVILLAPLALKPEDESPRGVKWSGAGAVPAIGDRIDVKINGMGAGTVIGYFVEPEPDNGWLGVKVTLDKRPDWHIKQCGPDRPWTLVFGAEIAPLEAA